MVKIAFKEAGEKLDNFTKEAKEAVQKVAVGTKKKIDQGKEKLDIIVYSQKKEKTFKTILKSFAKILNNNIKEDNTDEFKNKKIKEELLDYIDSAEFKEKVDKIQKLNKKISEEEKKII